MAGQVRLVPEAGLRRCLGYRVAREQEGPGVPYADVHLVVVRCHPGGLPEDTIQAGRGEPGVRRQIPQ